MSPEAYRRRGSKSSEESIADQECMSAQKQVIAKRDVYLFNKEGEGIVKDATSSLIL